MPNVKKAKCFNILHRFILQNQFDFPFLNYLFNNVCVMYAYLLNVQDFRIDVSVPEATDDCNVGPNTCSNY